MLPDAEILKETKLNLDLSRSSEDPQWVEKRIDHIQSTLSANESQARLLQDRIIAYSLIIDKQQKHLAVLKQPGVKQFWYKLSDRLESRLNKYETTWLKNLEKCNKAEQDLITINHTIRVARKQLQILQSAYYQFTTPVLENALTIQRNIF
ncbi:unnamed protein product [Adineta ricciae]|uniref:Uncharacterized protein n=1 Tax=Adineta ricciae TaxID=249248 RepID=A0A815XML2_ADIRI|nr:unnamed protein product [Adineta ricciae]